MTKLSTKQDFQAALKSTERELKPFYADLAHELGGLVSRYANADGVIPPQKSEALRNEARQIVEKYFIRYKVATANEKAAESTRLHELMAIAQKQIKSATQRQQMELRMRVLLIGKRIGLLEKHGVIVVTIDANGNGVSRYARLLTSNIDRVVKAAIGAAREQVKSVLHKHQMV